LTKQSKRLGKTIVKGSKATSPEGGMAMPHKYKTTLCKHFKESKTCPFGDNCNYAHGDAELQSFLEEQRL